MARCRFVYDNKALAATITATDAATGYPATFLSHRARWKPWRSAAFGAGSKTVEFDFGSTQTIKCIALANWKRHGTTGTIKAEYWNGAAYAAFDGATGLFSLPTSNRTRVTAIWFTAGRSTTKIRLTFAFVSGGSDYVELGTCIAGDYLEPTVNLSDTVAFEYKDDSDNVEADDGQELARERTKYLAIAMEFYALAASDRNSFLTMFDSVGSTRPLLFAVDPADLDQTVYGRFVEVMPVRGGDGLDRWTVPLAFKEVR